MSKELHAVINQFINIYRLIAPLFLCALGTWPPNAFMVLVLLIFFAPLLLTWLIPVKCSRLGCNGRLRVSSDRLSFWSVRVLYKCNSCDAECQAEIFSPNIEVTAEYS